MRFSKMYRMYHVETVPFTNRTHLVARSQRAARVATELRFINFKKEHAYMILPGDHESSVRVNRILSKIVGAICPRLASRTQEPLDWAAGLDWEAVVIRGDIIMAMCWGDAGKILVCAGLLECFDTDEEIAAALAHEVGHVIAKHSSEIIERFAKCKWFPTFLLSPFYRRGEIEADYIGMILLAASAFDPRVAPHNFEKLRKRGKKCMFNSILYFLALSTHPSFKERSKFLSRPKVMEEAMELYTQVTSTGQGSNKAYFPVLKL